MDQSQPRFQLGDVVQRANQAEAVGVVRDLRFNRQAEEWQYSVQFGAGARTLLESSLLPFAPPASPWEALAQGRVSGAEHLVAVLTFHRLRKPPTRIAASFATSRTEIHPHQFRPLLKFLDHPAKRLLIADDVGLGKTIEAGYVLRELEARGAVDRVLVLCPARLCPKWQREMDSRFQEQFKIVSGRDLTGLAQKLQRGREPDPFRWIISYESARAADVASAIEETQLSLDLLIVDEAHRLRNPSTLQHGLASVLAPLSDAVLFLTATPVQNRLEDLWNLLRLLSPETFQDWELFEHQIESNKPLFQAQDALRQRPPAREVAAAAIQNFFALQPQSSTGLAAIRDGLLERVGQLRDDRGDVTALQYDLSALSPTAPIISRTRKQEALPNRALRHARWCPVPLSPPERQFYESVESICRQLWSLDRGGAASAWPLQNAYRITASCIPAAVEYFTERLSRGQVTDLHNLIEEEQDTGERGKDETLYQGDPGLELSNAVEHYRALRDSDSKLNSLRQALTEMWAGDEKKGLPPRKVVVFSFFRRTLEYLRRELGDVGVSCRMIHGLVPVRDRETAIEEFLEEAGVRVLLTSEVGGEGIDLQKASAVVNYDLPWNPMVVEQRIGRIDRIGQRSERINIVNLVLQDSIEERILQRLFDKIGVFRESVGELDDILGNEIRELTMTALSGTLSPEELEQQVTQREEALERKVHDARSVMKRVDGLLAADQALVDEIDAVTGERQLPQAADVRLFLNHYLAVKFVGCQLPSAAMERVVKVEFQQGLAQELERRTLAIGTEAGVFARRIASGPIELTLSREVAYRHPTAELLHLKHPLVTLAVKDMEASAADSAVFSLALSGTKRLALGRYVFLVTLVELRGQRPSIRLCAAFADLDSDTVLADPDVTTPILLELSDHGASAEPLNLPAEMLDGARARVADALNELIAGWEDREKRLDHLRREQQHASRLAFLEVQARRAEERLAKVRRRSTHPVALRLNEARARKAQSALEAARSMAPTPLWDGVERQDIALGFLTVLGGESHGSTPVPRRP